MPDALFAAKEADATLQNQLLIVHLPAIDLQFVKELCLFHEHNASVATQLARNASFAVVVASKPIVHHAPVY